MPDIVPLDATRWHRIANGFEQAIELPPADRLAFLRSRLSDDNTALQEVLEMLAAYDGGIELSIEPRLLASDEPGSLGGERLGPYMVGELIGRGGMGEVYRADRHDGAFEQAVAIKVLRHGALARELVQRFEAERRILARLAHADIVTIIDGGTTSDRRPYLVMPLVHGQAITTFAAAERLGLDQRLRLFARVARAVQYAHGQLVVHRDIKPSNILVSPNGQLALLDFGIARLLDPTADDAADHTAASPLRLMTPEHAAPEQVRGERGGVAADIYALGVLLYELVTETRPHVRGTQTKSELEREILEDTPREPSVAGVTTTWRRRLRGDIDRIILMALRKEPERRYESAGQMAEDVERFLDGLPVRATNDRVSYRARRFLHRHRLGASIGTIAVAALCVLTIQALWQSRRAERERDVARRAEASMNGVVAMLTSLFEKANPAIAPGGDTVRVVELLALAEARIDSLASDTLTQAQLQVVLGEMHFARGRPDLAAKFLERARQTLERHPESDPLLLARATLNLARATTEYQGRTQALPLFERATTLYESALGALAGESQTARREWIAADTLASRLASDMERMVADSALATVTDTIERAERIHALGVQRYRAGDILAATPLFEEALRLVDLKLPANHPSRLVVMGTVAAARHKSGLFPQAEAMARTLRDEQERRVPANAVGFAHATEFLAIVQASRGFLEEAEARQRDAVKLWRAALASSHPSQWNALATLAAIVSARGHHAEALRLLDSASSLAQAGANEDRLFVAEQRVDALLRAQRFRDASLLLELTDRMVKGYSDRHTLQWSHQWRLAVAQHAAGNAGEARAALNRAEAGVLATVPVTHPLHAGIACLRGALAETNSDVRVASTVGVNTGNGNLQNATQSAPASVQQSCVRYQQWGTRVPLAHLQLVNVRSANAPLKRSERQ